MIESLRTKLLAERKRNLVQEMEIRNEMGDAMLQQLMESEELRRYVIFHLQEKASYSAAADGAQDQAQNPRGPSLRSSWP